MTSGMPQDPYFGSFYMVSGSIRPGRPGGFHGPVWGPLLRSFDPVVFVFLFVLLVISWCFPFVFAVLGDV